jgi:hypothetical protein
MINRRRALTLTLHYERLQALSGSSRCTDGCARDQRQPTAVV